MSLILNDRSFETVYIAGPMRGHDNFNFPAFMEEEEKLRREYGIEVINPARKEQDLGFDPTGLFGSDAELDTAGFDLQAALEWDARQIIYSAEAVILLPGWEESNGARFEFFLARALRKPTYEIVGGSYYLVGEEVFVNEH